MVHKFIHLGKTTEVKQYLVNEDFELLSDEVTHHSTTTEAHTLKYDSPEKKKRAQKK